MTTLRGRRRRPLLVLGLLGLLAGPAGVLPAAGATDEDPALEQQLSGDERVVEEAAELGLGHVDMGPLFLDGSWTFMVHDDSSAAESVWRHTEQTVFRVDDAALRTVPDDPAYDFLHAEPGQPVHVLPQTQDPDVVWLGWNTQDPEVMERIDRGVTMRLDGVEGPGSMVVYLQSGNLGAPEPLWDSENPDPQDLWVDVNTHTHANWVFTEPGVYLAQVTLTADLVDGDRVSDTRTLRFAVGTGTSAEEALAASPLPVPGPGSDAGEPAPAADEAGSGGVDLTGTLLLGTAVAAAALVILFAVTTLLGRRSKKRALADRTQGAGA
ncbi:choice-of-anchor M domain-containing protein [Blastococcus haudaquaticus]|uniref:Putative ABC transporter-associated repeat protein n=1 Tax=Blastococcus haudaquaticus TaxID=1938745 RepID=A0A286H3F8_9ACTN|nr:choice-of-anchor M domain-containing protein [Blastococcus haudaquaticus]SOE02232.1 putative ABC transporter-associated repeat protein [Blastococcus haudaquaticus]